MLRTMTCIICPRGCFLTAEVTDTGVNVIGNACPRGAEYATNECVNPVRTVTATIRVSNRHNTMVSVKTAAPIPKGNMLDVMAKLRTMAVEAPLAIGDVVISNLFGTDVVITKAID